MEFIPRLGRNDDCWCASGAKYKSCHGAGPASAPGAPVPEDDEDVWWVSPTVSIARGALSTNRDGVPITMQEDPDRPVAGPLIVPRFCETLSVASGVGAGASFRDLGLERYQALADLGLDDPATLESQLTVLSDDALREVGQQLALIGRQALDVLDADRRSPEPRSVLWTDTSQVSAMIGQTLLWADIYVINDPLLEAFLLREEIDRDSLGSALLGALEMRSLVETGLVVPVPSGVAALIAADAVRRATEYDLADRELVTWVDGELVLEGPTAREVLFVHARDDAEEGFFTHFRKVRVEDDGRFEMVGLRPYERDFDYGPWIKTVRNQFIARLVQDMNKDLSIADLFGGEYVTRLPFRARLAARRKAPSAPAIAASIEVPWLPGVEPAKLAKLAAEDEAVGDLRTRVSRLVHASPNPSTARNDLSTLVGEIAEDAVGPLNDRLRRDRTWRMAVPGGFMIGGLALGATAGPIGLAAAALGGAGWAATAWADYKQGKADAGYLFWSAAPLERRGRSRPRR